MQPATTGDAGGQQPSDGDVPIRRAIGTKMLIMFVVGDILGAGIYVRVGGVAAEVGGAIWMSFLLAMLIASLTALSYAELASKYPSSGGAALFVNKAFRQPFLTLMVGFAVMASGIVSAGTVARAFGGRYIQEFMEVPSLPVALIFILGIALINLRGIAESIKLKPTPHADRDRRPAADRGHRGRDPGGQLG